MSIPIVGASSSPVRAQTTVPPGAQPNVANPEISESCGLNVALVLDASGSIGNNERNVRKAGEAFLDALADTGSTARVLQFASLSEQLAPQTEVTAASLQNGGVFRNALNDYYNPKPPRPSNVNIYQYDGSGDPQSSSNWRLSNGSNQYTNWDASLGQAGETQPLPTDLVLYVTDGDPTAYDFDQSGDPFDAGPPPDVGMNTNRGSAATTTLDRAVEEANQLKSAGARMLAVGVGSALNNAQSENRLKAIAGPNAVRNLGSVSSINDIDVALVTNFEDLAQFLRSVVNKLCSPALSIRKLAQTPDSADYTPAANWSITVTPTVTGGNFKWILPDGDTDPDVQTRCGAPSDPLDGLPRTCLTLDTGLANFQWEPNPDTATSTATVVERPQQGFTPGRPGPDNDWTCNRKNDQGSLPSIGGELVSDGAGGFRFDLDPFNISPQEIITCTIYNSFDYSGRAISLEKVDSPVQVRGDLGAPGSSVTSTFTVTNPGTSALRNVKVTDDKCTPV